MTEKSKKEGMAASLLENYMYKRPLMKSSLLRRKDFKGRWFVLKFNTLSYYSGQEDGKPEKMKEQISIKNIRLVEKCEDEKEFDKPNIFQILFDSDSGKESYLLYIAACSCVQQEMWITRLRTVLVDHNIKLNDKYHIRAYNYSRRWYNCCERHGINAPGCVNSEFHHLTSFRNKGENGFETNRNEMGIGSTFSDKPKSIRVTALYDYDPVEGDIALVRGEFYDIINQSEPHWWKAVDKHGNQGFIPSNYVKIITDIGLEQYDWYARNTSRLEAEKRVSEGKKEGTFLVRDSTSPGQYTLTLFVKEPSSPQGSVRHYHIKQDDNKMFYVSEKHRFDSIADLIQYHKYNSAGLAQRLKTPPEDQSSAKPATVGLGHDMWEIDRSELALKDLLGKGMFGTVKKAIWKSSKGSRTTIVAVKSMLEGSMNDDDFIAEAQTMKVLQHPNLVQLYGVCTKEKPIYIVTEFMANGSLLKFLQKSKSTLVGRTAVIVDMCLQVCSAMEYLELMHFIHRDLAARNCLVSDTNIVKVADFGLTRFVKDDQYTSSAGSKFPIKWAPPEVLQYMRFSSKSDVWAFGILMWEIFSFGEQPYGRMRNDEVCDQLTKKNYRLPSPPSCPQGVYAIMWDCWLTEAANRPTFSDMSLRLSSMQDSGGYDG